MRLIANTVTTEVHDIHTRAKGVLDDVSSYLIAGAWFSPAYKRGQWDGRCRFMKYNRSRRIYELPTGLLDRATRALDEANVRYDLEDQRTILFPPEAQCKLAPDIDLSVGKWDYQAEVLNLALTRGRGILSVPTGGGKTEIAAGIIKSIEQPTLWLTDSLNLFYQTQDRLQTRLGWKVGLVGDGIFEPDFVTVVMIQSADKKQDRMARLFEQCQLVIGDEIHHLEADQWYDNLTKIQAPWRFGITATPNMEGPGLALVAMMGEIIAKVDSLDLMARRVLVVPRIWFCNVNYPTLDKSLRYQQAYKEGIVEHEGRNLCILNVAGTFKNEGRPCITLVKQIRHGEFLADYFSNSGIRSEFLSGKTPEDERKVLLRNLQEGRIQNLVANVQIMGEGADLPWLDALINATGSKGGGSKVEGEIGRVTTQVLGRILRCSEGKAKADYVDIADHTHKHLKQASLARVRTLEALGYTPFMKYWDNYVA